MPFQRGLMVIGMKLNDNGWMHEFDLTAVLIVPNGCRNKGVFVCIRMDLTKNVAPPETDLPSRQFQTTSRSPQKLGNVREMGNMAFRLRIYKKLR